MGKLAGFWGGKGVGNERGRKRKWMGRGGGNGWLEEG